MKKRIIAMIPILVICVGVMVYFTIRDDKSLEVVSESKETIKTEIKETNTDKYEYEDDLVDGIKSIVETHVMDYKLEANNVMTVYLTGNYPNTLNKVKEIKSHLKRDNKYKKTLVLKNNNGVEVYREGI